MTKSEKRKAAFVEALQAIQNLVAAAVDEADASDATTMVRVKVTGVELHDLYLRRAESAERKASTLEADDAKRDENSYLAADARHVAVRLRDAAESMRFTANHLDVSRHYWLDVHDVERLFGRMY